MLEGTSAERSRFGTNHALKTNAIMNVAIPIWDGRVSPVMDTARHLLVTEFADGGEVSRETVVIPQADISSRVSFLADLGIDVLICGAISHQFERMLAASGIESFPWFRGNVDEIMAAYSGGVLQNDSFLLPGCGRRRRRGRGGPRGWGPGSGRRRRFKEV